MYGQIINLYTHNISYMLFNNLQFKETFLKVFQHIFSCMYLYSYACTLLLLNNAIAVMVPDSTDLLW